ncbi:MAG: SCP2 sterol-binding domain-containing protein [Halieaceae bacterium]|nr:SCP2 sterol-binding domain-containing protein [Halieaceae bacterium]
MNEIRNPTLHTAGLAAAEAAANAALRLSPHSMAGLRKLAGEVVALECTRPAVTVYINGEENGEIRLRGVYDGKVSTRITGSAEDFGALARAEDPAAELINGGLRLEGNSATLVAMQRLFNEMDVDWEAPLVAGLGDVAGHQLANMLRAAFDWSRETGENLQRQLREYATEEGRLAPPPLALEHFYEDVQALSERGDRLAARIERLRQRVEALRAQRAP